MEIKPGLKTLIITLEYPPQIGGIASYVDNMAGHLSEPLVVYAPCVKNGHLFDKEKARVTYRKNPYWFFVWPRWIRLLWQVWRIVKKEKIQLIHVHHVLPVGYVAFLIRKFLKIPYILFLHGTDFNLATRSQVKMKNFKKIFATANYVVVNSNFMREKIKNTLELSDSEKIKVVYASPSDIFLEKKYTEEELKNTRSELALEGKKVMLTVARLAEGKGFPLIISYVPRLLAAVPNLVWVIIGDGPKKSQILEMIQKKSYQNIVRFLGEIRHDNLPKYYQMADVFVLLTHKDDDAEEGLGTAFLEASASRLPVIAGRVGGVEEAVKNLETGLVVNTHQENAVINSIVELFRNREFAKKMGEAGEKRVKEQFTWKKQMQNMPLL